MNSKSNHGGGHPKNKIMDHLGNRFNSYEEMAKFWHIGITTLKRRRGMGWTWCRTLTTPVPPKNKKIFCRDFRYDVAEEKSSLNKILNLFLKECDKVEVIEYFVHFGFFIKEYPDYFPGMEALLYRLYYVTNDNKELPVFVRAEYPQVMCVTGNSAKIFMNEDVAFYMSLYELKILFKALLIQGIHGHGILVHGRFYMKQREYERSQNVKKTTH